MSNVVNIAEVYSNTNNLYLNKNKNKNTFQQEHVNVSDASRPTCASHDASRPSGEKTEEEKDKEQECEAVPSKSIRFMTSNDYVTDIRINTNRIRSGTRHERMTAYMSIKTDTDKKFSIFIRSSLTSSLDETYRSIRASSNSEYLLSCADNFKQEFAHASMLLLGRLRYTPKGGFVTDDHRRAMRTGLLGFAVIDGKPHARLYLFNEVYDLAMQNELSSKQQRYYDLEGIWARDYGELEDEL
jgi:hypothetical protein